MSSIDERVVKMQFDNAQFETGVSKSLRTLGRLKEALNLKSTAKNLQSFQDSVHGDLTGLGSSLDILSRRFSSMGIFSGTVLANLATDAYRYGKKITTSLLGAINAGGKARAFNIEQAKFQLKGLGVAWEKIEEDISYGVKDTAYGLDVAAKAASQLIASGVKFGKDSNEMKAALRGISGVAAMTNSTYEDTARIFTTISGNGRLMGNELNSLGARGLNAAAILGKALNKSEQEIRDMVRKGQIDFNTFAKIMDDAFGKHAKDANKTFTGAMSNVKSALSRIGADFYAPMIDSADNRKFRNIIDVLNAVRTKIDEIHVATKPFAEFINNILKKFSADAERAVNALDVSNFPSVLNRIQNGMSSAVRVFYILIRALSTLKAAVEKVIPIEGILATIGDVFKDVFGKNTLERAIDYISKLTTKFTFFSKSLTSNTQLVKNFHDIFKGIFSLVRSGSVILEPLFGFLKQIVGIFGSLIMGITDIAAALGRAVSEGDAAKNIANALSEVFGKLSGKIKSLTSNLRSGNGIFGYFTDLFKVIAKIPGAISDTIGQFFKFDQVAQAFQAGFLYFIVHKIRILVMWIKQTASLKTGFLSVIYEFKDALWNFTNGLRYKQINEVGKALLKLAVALLILSTINPERLANSTVAMSLLFSELIGFMAIFNKMNAGGLKNIISFGFAMSALNGLVTTMLLLSVSLKIMSSINFDQMLVALTGMTAGLYALIKALKVISDIKTKDVVKSATTLKTLAGSLIILALALKLMASMSWGELVKGLTGMTGGLLGLVGALQLMSKISDATIKSNSKVLITLSTALLILTFAMSKLAGLSWGDLAQSLVGVAGGLGLLISEIWMLNQIGSTNIISSSVALLTMSSSLLVLSGALKILASMGWTDIGQSMLALSGGLSAMVLALTLLSSHALGALGASTALLILSGALVVLSGVLVTLGALPTGVLVTGLVALAGALGVLIVAASLAIPVIPALLALGAAIVGIGVGIGTATAGIGVLAIGIAAVISAITGFITIGVPALDGFWKHVTKFTTNMIKELPNFLNNLAKQIETYGPEINAAFIRVLKAFLLNTIDFWIRFGSEIWPYLKKFGAFLIDKVIVLKGKIIAKAKQIWTSIKEEVSSWPGRMLKFGKNIIDGLLDGLKEKLDSVLSFFTDLGNKALTKFKDVFGIHSPSKKMHEVGKNIVYGFVNGLKDTKGKALDAFVKTFVDPFKLTTKELPKILRAAISNYKDSFSGVSGEFGKFSITTKQARLSVIEYANALYKKTGQHKEDTKVIKENIKELRKLQNELNKVENSNKLSDKEKKSRVKKLKSDIIKSEKELQEALKAPAKGMAKAYEEMQKQISDSIKSSLNVLSLSLDTQLDMFKKFEDTTEITAADILINMESQINGVKEWNRNLKTLSEKGFTKDILDKLRDMGPQAANHVKAFMTMTSEEMNKANELFKEKATMTAETLLNNFSNKITEAKQFSADIREMAKAGFNKDLIELMGQQGLGASEYVRAFLDMTGGQIQEFNRMFVESIKLPDSLTQEVMTSIAATGKQNLENMLGLSTEEAKTSGSRVSNAFVTGLQEKMNSMIPAVKTAAYNLAKDVQTETKRNLNREKGINIAKVFADGLVEGLNASGSRVKEAAVSIARTAYQAAMSVINDELSTPIITPVLDLTGVKANANQLTTLLNSSIPVSLPMSGNGQALHTNGNVTFVQNNYSPRALDRMEVYRQTQNQIKTVKKILKGGKKG